MNIIDFSQMYPELNVTIKAGELIEAIDHCIRSVQKEMTNLSEESNTETYPTPDEVAKILGVSRSTLWRWAKLNYLVPVEVGGKRRYRMSDIKKILEK